VRSTRLPVFATLCLALASLLTTACGGGPELDKEGIRRNADDADRDLDRESSRNAD
jgi:hypothetical protein